MHLVNDHRESVVIGTIDRLDVDRRASRYPNVLLRQVAVRLGPDEPLAISRPQAARYGRREQFVNRVQAWQAGEI